MTDAALAFEDRLFGPLVSGRECGGCTACCFELTIDDPELSKPPRQACVHCAPQGCAIYEVRPRDCRTWFCGWRRIAELPQELRPDRCGLLATLVVDRAAANPFQRLYLIVQWLDGRPVQRSAAADALLAALQRRSLPVWVGSADRMSLHFPRQEVALVVMGAKAASGAVAGEVEAWRRRLPAQS